MSSNFRSFLIWFIVIQVTFCTVFSTNPSQPQHVIAAVLLILEVFVLPIFFFLQAFFLSVVLVATIIYLGTVGDYFKLGQYAVIAPKKESAMKGESEYIAFITSVLNMLFVIFLFVPPQA